MEKWWRFPRSARKDGDVGSRCMGSAERGKAAAPGSGPVGRYGEADPRIACPGRGHPAMAQKEKEILGECSGKPRCGEGRVLTWGWLSHVRFGLTDLCSRTGRPPDVGKPAAAGFHLERAGRRRPRRAGQAPHGGSGGPARGGPGLETVPRGEKQAKRTGAVIPWTLVTHTTLH